MACNATSSSLKIAYFVRYGEFQLRAFDLTAVTYLVYDPVFQILVQYMRISAVFAVARCPSVRPSVTLVHCIQTAENIVILLSRPGSPTILAFLTASAGTHFQAEPFSSGVKYTEVGKLCYFRLKSPFISEMVRDMPMVAMER